MDDLTSELTPEEFAAMAEMVAICRDARRVLIAVRGFLDAPVPLQSIAKPALLKAVDTVLDNAERVEGPLHFPR